MSKGELAAHFATKFDLTRAQAKALFDELAMVAAKEARHGFTLPGLGKLVMVKRKARMGRNPKTGEAIKIPAKTVLKFRIAKACKDAVLGSK
jgi:DNA-binding protein HU-beta